MKLVRKEKGVIDIYIVDDDDSTERERKVTGTHAYFWVCFCFLLLSFFSTKVVNPYYTIAYGSSMSFKVKHSIFK
jgi:hypothetical protein